MKSFAVSSITFAAVALALALGVTATADDASKSAGKSGETASVSAAPVGGLGGMPIYKPKNVGKPARTVGGGSRGVGDTVPQLFVLVPNHVAQTASDQPSLFWFVSTAPGSKAKVEFTLLDEDGIEPLVEAKLPTPKRAGIQRIRLADHGVKLQPGLEYEWSVAIIPDPTDRAKDIVSTGWIDRVARPGDLDQRLASEGNARSIHVFADEGLWYDALTALGDRIEKQPSDPDLSEMRSSLLKQVGLETVATSNVL